MRGGERNMHLKKRILLAVAVSCGFFLMACQFLEKDPTTKNLSQIDLETINHNSIIAHASGGIDDYTYVNCVEAFVEHYEAGTRLFEIDFQFTSDDELVGVHYWSDLGEEYSSENRVTLAEYEALQLKGQYTGITLKNLVTMMDEQYPDVAIILDTKEADYVKFFNKLVEDVSDINDNLLRNFIPQLYDEEMFTELENIHQFDFYIYTLYKTAATNEEVYLFLAANERIIILTVSVTRILSMDADFINSVNALGRRIFVHTINSYEEMQTYHDLDVSGFYSDFIDELAFDEHVWE